MNKFSRRIAARLYNYRIPAGLALMACILIPFGPNFLAVGAAGRHAEFSLHKPGPSSTFGNFGKAITTDGFGYVDAVWLQGPTTTNTSPHFIYAGPGTIVFAQSWDQGVTWSGSVLTAFSKYITVPKITSFGPHIYVAWSAQAGGSLKIFLIHGVRNGRLVNWSAPQVISDFPVNASFPVLAAYGDEIHVAWSENRTYKTAAGRTVTGITEVYYMGSMDNGSTWSNPVPISPLDGSNSWTPSIAVFSNYVHIAWTDARFGLADCTTRFSDCHEVLYYRNSIDFGHTWREERPLTCDASIYTFAPHLITENNTLHIAYFQGTPYPPGVMNLYYLRSKNNGDSLAACSGTQGTQPMINVQYPASDNVLSAWRPNISVYNGLVHMVWWGELTINYATGQAKIYYTKSNDGVNWDSATSLTPQSDGSTYRSFSPNISLSPDGSKVYTIWEDHRDQDPNYQVYFRSFQ